MSTDQKLKKLDDFLHTFSTETGDGLCGEAGYYVFSYDPKDEMKVRQWTECETQILQQSNRPVVEFDLYKIMTALLAEKHPRQKYEDLELPKEGCYYSADRCWKVLSPAAVPQNFE